MRLFTFEYDFSQLAVIAFDLNAKTWLLDLSPLYKHRHDYVDIVVVANGLDYAGT